jgi:hypothetical protein
MVVDWLLITRDNYCLGWVQNVYKHPVIQVAKNLLLTCTHFIQVLSAGFMNSIFIQLTSISDQLYTLSTQSIKTIYLNKRVEE